MILQDIEREEISNTFLDYAGGNLNSKQQRLRFHFTVMIEDAVCLPIYRIYFRLRQSTGNTVSDQIRAISFAE